MTNTVGRGKRLPMLGLIRLIIFGLAIYFLVRFVRNLLMRVGQATGATTGSGWTNPTRPPPSSSTSGSKSPYEVLGISSSATQNEIRTAYQNMVRQYHPDRVADLGPELKEVAEERTKEINEAYAKLRQR